MAVERTLSIIKPDAVAKNVIGQQLPANHVVEGLEGEIRINRAGAVAEQQRHVVHLARFSGLDDQPDLDA